MRSIVPGPESPYTIDECKIRGEADLVIFPENAEDIAEVLRDAYGKSIPVTVSANRTGLCGGGVPDEGWVMSLEGMPGLIGMGQDDEGYYVRIGPGVSVRTLTDTMLLKRIEGLTDLTPDACGRFRRDPRRFFYPVDPTEMDGSVCGNIATNASGPRTLKYGPTRDWVRWIRVVLPDGRIIGIRRGEHHAEGRRFDCTVDDVHLSFDAPRYDFNTAVKNAAGLYAADGMDLIDLFIGSEGVLGVIAEAEVRLTEWHPLLSVIAFMPDDDSALSLIDDLRDSTVSPEFLEYFDCASIDLVRRVSAGDPTLLTPPEGRCSAVFLDMDAGDGARMRDLADIISSHGGSPSRTWAGSDAGDRRRMFEFRHCVPKSIFDYVAGLKEEMPAINKMGTDMSVPREQSPGMMSFYREKLEESGLEYVIFGHMGNFHPHVEIILKDMADLEKAREVYDVFAAEAVRRGGSPSAEHGIGKLKRRYIGMMYGSGGEEDIRRVKRYFDPGFILNRGDMVA